MKRLLVAALAAGLLSATPASANLILNGNFETGTFANWTQFTTPDGRIGTTTTPGTPQVTSFNTTGSGASLAAEFSVAQIIGAGGAQEGGGIFQNFFTSSGKLDISMDIAVDRPSTVPNAEGGVFKLLLDSVEIDSFTTGDITNQTIRSVLSASGDFGAGTHELRILITRPFGESDFELAQYVDNVVVNETAPAPATLGLLGLGLAGLGWSRRKRH